MMKGLVDSPGADGHLPIEIKLKSRERRLEIQFENGQTFWYPAEYLRTQAPGLTGPVAGCRHVGILDVEAEGEKAIRIRFDDGFENGAFTWELLYNLGKDYESRWKAYLQEIELKNLSRDP